MTFPIGWPALSVTLWSAGAIALAQFVLWLLSLKLKDVSIVDLFWGTGFVIVAAIGLALGPGPEPRRWLVFALVALWGLRLSGYLWWRHRGKGEDPRYGAMRTEHGDAWPLMSLLWVFGLQAVLIWWVSLPLQVAQSHGTALNAFDALGAILVLVGVAFEAIGDYQLLRFKSDPANRGKVLDTGLWRYTRHPNYFGDFCVWWGLYALAVATGAGAWTVGSPLVMSWLLMRVSGVALTEKRMGDRPGYSGYIARTSAFFPRPPRS